MVPKRVQHLVKAAQQGLRSFLPSVVSGLATSNAVQELGQRLLQIAEMLKKLDGLATGESVQNILSRVDNVATAGSLNGPSGLGKR